MEHEAEKPYKCNLCDKAFYMKWRLGKHLKQHESFDAKFCHYFNNGKFCPFEEHGCMFKHENAQFCNKKLLCRTPLCQFMLETMMYLMTLMLTMESSQSGATMDCVTFVTFCLQQNLTFMHTYRVILDLIQMN